MNAIASAGSVGLLELPTTKSVTPVATSAAPPIPNQVARVPWLSAPC